MDRRKNLRETIYRTVSLNQRKEKGKACLVILAAGLGSRYNGLKQLDGFGPHGEPLMLYSIFEAHKAGFESVILVIRKDFEEECRKRLVDPLKGVVDIKLAFQEIGNLPRPFFPPPSRVKPWGTGHAILAAKDLIDTPFAVINADDLYGFEAFRLLRRFLGELNPKSKEAGLVAYLLGNTLSSHGMVNRGVLECSEGRLKSISEKLNIRRLGDKIVHGAEEEVEVLDSKNLVSMNCWGFPLAFLDLLEEGFKRFLISHVMEPSAEYFLFESLSQAIEKGEFKVKVFHSQESWLGVTYGEDKDRVREAIHARIQAGEYPSRFGKN